MQKTSFIHVGLTVSNLERTVDFYRKYFGFEVVLSGQFPDGFFDAKPSLYRLPKGMGSKIAILKSPDGAQIELFEFLQQTPFRTPEWNTPGYHHICIHVEDVNETYRRMKADGIKFYFEPDYMGDPNDHKYWVFLQDPDGNMIELQ